MTRLCLICRTIHNFFDVKNFQCEEKLLYNFTHAENFTHTENFCTSKKLQRVQQIVVYYKWMYQKIEIHLFCCSRDAFRCRFLQCSHLIPYCSAIFSQQIDAEREQRAKISVILYLVQQQQNLFSLVAKTLFESLRAIHN